MYAGDVTPTEAFEAASSDPAAVIVDVRTRPELIYVGAPALAGIGKKLSPHTVRREREAGRLPFIRIRDLVRYRPEDVEAYLQHQSHDDYELRPTGTAKVAAIR